MSTGNSQHEYHDASNTILDNGTTRFANLTIYIALPAG